MKRKFKLGKVILAFMLCFSIVFSFSGTVTFAAAPRITGYVIKDGNDYLLFNTQELLNTYIDWKDIGGSMPPFFTTVFRCGNRR